MDHGGLLKFDEVVFNLLEHFLTLHVNLRSLDVYYFDLQITNLLENSVICNFQIKASWNQHNKPRKLI